MKLILLGAPGAGKGTQADLISQKLSIPILGTGNLLREAVKNSTPNGLKAKSYMDSGGLVPDDIVIELLRERMEKPDCKNGYILDGFPRNVEQAKALDEMGIVVDRVINLFVSDEAIIARMSGRRVCSACGKSYHVVNIPPKVQDICDSCGEKLIIRSDDAPETVKNRLATYHDQTVPLIDYYKNEGKLVEVIGQEELKDTTRLTMEALEATL